MALREEMCYIAELSVGFDECFGAIHPLHLVRSRSVVTLVVRVSSLISILRRRSITYHRLANWQHTMVSSKLLLSILLAFTSTAWALPHPIVQRQEPNNAVAASAPPRLVAYIQTFRSVDGGPLSLLPLLNEHTGVTHILLSAVHLNEQPGDITLNDHHPNDPMYDTLWSEVKQLQDGGIKVMMLSLIHI